MAAREGQRLGRYTLVRSLGRGGGGEAWEAVLHGPRGFTRSVALKLLPDGVAGRELDNLIHEARIGALLQHPNLVATHELAEIDGVVFIAMELVHGMSVRELARRGPLGGAVVLDIGVQACAGLAHLHAAQADGVPLGLVHRDVKPANLLVDLTGLVKLADFGISRSTADAGHTSGTPGYAPPEQFAGEVDARADLFALGATLAALILREPPFGRTTAGASAAVAARLADPRFLARLEAGLAGGARVLARALAPDPADRFPTAAAFQDALASLRSAQAPAPSLRELVSAGATTSPGVELPAEVAPEAEPTQVARGNLAAPGDAFVPRPEWTALTAALDAGHRLVVLTGPGGMGKTRLAIEAARARDRAGGWLFELAEVTTLDGLLGALAGGLRLELGADPTPERVGHALRALGPAVVVLDNLEQVVRPARSAVERFLALAPELVILATSRAPLQAQGEHRLAVGPLPTAAAVALFRARAPRALDAGELPEVGALVDAVDGMPLAVELLAARVGRVPPTELRRDLESHLARATAPDRPRRQRSVEATLAGTWDALPAWGRRALARLAVFEGRFTARAVAAVLDPADLAPHAPIDALELLAEVGFLRYDDALRRFGMSRVVRAFALARLEPESKERALRRHERVYAALGDRDVLALLRGPEGTARFARLVADMDNLLAATRRALDRGEASVVVPLLRAVSAVAMRRGPLAPLVALLDRAVALPGLSGADRDELHLSRARALREAGDPGESRRVAEEVLREVRARAPDRARSRLEAEGLLVVAVARAGLLELAVAEVAARSALQHAREAGDPVLEAEASLVVGSILGSSARVDEARDWLEVALAGFRRLGSARDEARVLSELGRAEHLVGRFAVARAAYQQALAATREAGDRVNEIAVLRNLGLLEKDLRRSTDADALYREGLATATATGDRASELWLWGALGYLHLELLDAADAEGPLRQAVALATELSDPTLCQWEAALARLCARRGDHEGAAGWLAAATGREAARASTLRVWVRAAAAEVAARGGRRDEARAELDALEKWLTARNVDPGSRWHQEVQRVRVLCTEKRR
jgi:predicted ATPase